MMILQILTGARPGEVCAMRAGDLYLTSDPAVWEYRVRDDTSKTAHHDSRPARIVYLGPRSRRVLAPVLERCTSPDDYLFRPADADAELRARKAAARRTPAYPSHSRMARTARRAAAGSTPRVFRPCYTVSAYGKAIARACDAAGVDRFTPNQLRHTAATEIASRTLSAGGGIDVAQRVLGHASISTTMRYVSTKDHKAITAAKRRA
jgi:integrase